MWMSSTLGLP